jgi:hypothetical protein
MNCQYKDLFGAAGEGVHSYRLFGFAIVDVVLTILGAAWIAWVTRWPLLPTLFGLFVLGIVVHRIFCVRSTVDKLIFSHGREE